MLSLADQRDRDRTEPDQIASAHLEAAEAKIAQLLSLRDELGQMADQCRGGRVDSCRIMEALGDHNQCRSGHN